jgi:hypothetical protein
MLIHRHSTRINATSHLDGNIPPRSVLAPIFDNEGEAIKFLIRRGVITVNCCPYCNGPSTWKCAWPEDTKLLPSRACIVLRCKDDYRHEWSPFYGSVFFGCRKPCNVILELLYCWACRDVQCTVSKRLQVQRNTVGTYYRLFREICMVDKMSYLNT